MITIRCFPVIILALFISSTVSQQYTNGVVNSNNIGVVGINNGAVGNRAGVYNNNARSVGSVQGSYNQLANGASQAINNGYQGNSFHADSVRGNNNFRSSINNGNFNGDNFGIKGNGLQESNGVHGLVNGGFHGNNGIANNNKNSIVHNNNNGIVSNNNNGIVGNFGNGFHGNSNNGIHGNFVNGEIGNNNIIGSPGKNPAAGSNIHRNNAVVGNLNGNNGHFQGNNDGVRNFHRNNGIIGGQGQQETYSSNGALHGGIIEGTRNFRRNGFKPVNSGSINGGNRISNRVGKGNQFVGGSSQIGISAHIGNQLNSGISEGFVGRKGLGTGIGNSVHNGINVGINNGLSSNVGGTFNNGLKGGNFISGNYGGIAGSVNGRINNGLRGHDIRKLNGPVEFSNTNNVGSGSQTYFNNGQGSFGKVDLGGRNRKVNFDGKNNYGSPVFGNMNGFDTFSNNDFGSDFGNSRGNGNHFHSDGIQGNTRLGNTGSNVYRNNGIVGNNINSATGFGSNGQVAKRNNFHINQDLVSGNGINNKVVTGSQNLGLNRNIGQIPHQNLGNAASGRFHNNGGKHTINNDVHGVVSNGINGVENRASFHGIVRNGINGAGNRVHFVGNDRNVHGIDGSGLTGAGNRVNSIGSDRNVHGIVGNGLNGAGNRVNIIGNDRNIHGIVGNGLNGAKNGVNFVRNNRNVHGIVGNSINGAGNRVDFVGNHRNVHGIVGNGLIGAGNGVNFVGDSVGVGTHGINIGHNIVGAQSNIDGFQGYQVVNRPGQSDQIYRLHDSGIVNGGTFEGYRRNGNNVGTIHGGMITNIGSKPFIKQALGISGMRTSDVLGNHNHGTLQKIQQF